jgi:hypothetical protein
MERVSEGLLPAYIHVELVQPKLETGELTEYAQKLLPFCAEVMKRPRSQTQTQMPTQSQSQIQTLAQVQHKVFHRITQRLRA